MIIYLDSSVLVKKYFSEIGSEIILKLWNDNTHFAISQVGFSEILGTINKKQKVDRFSDKIKNRVISNFLEDWDQMIKVNVDNSVKNDLLHIHSKYLLRGFDAIHLVSAKIIFKELEEESLFLCADDNLAKAAKKDGMSIGSYLWK
jgi:uncharacterized protein